MTQRMKREGKRKYSQMVEHETDFNFTFFEVQVRPNHQIDELQKTKPFQPYDKNQTYPVPIFNGFQCKMDSQARTCCSDFSEFSFQEIGVLIQKPNFSDELTEVGDSPNFI